MLSSAREHFERFGYHGSSVEAMADAAGFSKGVIYSQFGSKDELMLAVLEASIEQWQRDTEQLGDAVGLDELMGEAFATSLRTRAWQAALAEFRIHAWRDDELNRRYRELHERTIEKVAAGLGRVLGRQQPPGGPTERDLAVGLLAANVGLVIESLAGREVDMVDFVQSMGSALQAEPTTASGAAT